MRNALATIMQPNDAERLEAVFRLAVEIAELPCFDARPLMSADLAQRQHLERIQDKLAVLLSVAASDDSRRAARLLSAFPAVFGVRRVKP
jgi:hypothetical protein